MVLLLSILRLKITFQLAPEYTAFSTLTVPTALLDSAALEKACCHIKEKKTALAGHQVVR